jgi:hypothetical protein
MHLERGDVINVVLIAGIFLIKYMQHTRVAAVVHLEIII